MTFTDDQIAQIEHEWEEVSSELTALCSTLVIAHVPLLTNDRAKEYLVHGVGRRLKLIARCIENIFAVFPVRRHHLLTEEERSDLEINLHAFVINVYGLQDNLAWVYVLENSLDDKIEKGRLGIGLFNRHTQKYLPDEVRAYLGSDRVKNWHDRYAKNYRDALSHRIPLYVPPSQMTPEEAQRYQNIEKQILESLKAGDLDRSDALAQEQASIGNICKAFLHSYSDCDLSWPVYFHPQLIADGKMVIKIVNTVLRHVPAAD